MIIIISKNLLQHILGIWSKNLFFMMDRFKWIIIIRFRKWLKHITEGSPVSSYYSLNTQGYGFPASRIHLLFVTFGLFQMFHLTTDSL